MRDLAGRRVTVMGLGRHGGGVAAVRYLSEQGAVVTVTDLADEDALQDSLEKLADLRDLRFHLGAHHENDFSEADVLVVNPAVKPDNRFVQLAIQSGARDHFGDRTLHEPLPRADHRCDGLEWQIDHGHDDRLDP